MREGARDRIDEIIEQVDVLENEKEELEERFPLRERK